VYACATFIVPYSLHIVIDIWGGLCTSYSRLFEVAIHQRCRRSFDPRIRAFWC